MQPEINNSNDPTEIQFVSKSPCVQCGDLLDRRDIHTSVGLELCERCFNRPLNAHPIIAPFMNQRTPGIWVLGLTGAVFGLSYLFIGLGLLATGIINIYHLFVIIPAGLLMICIGFYYLLLLPGARWFIWLMPFLSLSLSGVLVQFSLRDFAVFLAVYWVITIVGLQLFWPERLAFGEVPDRDKLFEVIKNLPQTTLQRFCAWAYALTFIIPILAPVTFFLFEFADQRQRIDAKHNPTVHVQITREKMRNLFALSLITYSALYGICQRLYS